MELPMKRYPRWDRLITAAFSFLAFSSQAHGSDLHSSQRLVNINSFASFASIENVEKCLSNLHLADGDGDLLLEREEYVYYIFLQSAGSQSYEGFQDLPLSLLSNYLFTACTCSQAQGPECCVGDKIGIQLDEKGEVVSVNISAFCVNVDRAIQGELNPTPSPSLAPTRPPAPGPTPVPTSPPTTTAPNNTPSSVAPTITVSNGPTGAPTKSPAVSPSSTPTGSPTIVAPSSTASDVPSLVPTESPTSRPTMAPVPGQTDMPTTAPSQAPTKSLSNSPTGMPSASPTGMLSMNPTSAPTKSPTEQPSSTPTAAPSIAQTPAPSTSDPSASPTQMPAPEPLACVSFQYGISNDNGFSASDIFNEVNNTYKTGLILATRNVTIETLNATFPRDDSGRFLREESVWRHRINPLVRYGQANKEELKFDSLGSLGTRGLHVANLQDSKHLQSFVLRESIRSNGNRRRTVYLPQQESDGEIIDVSQLSRQLVFYTDEDPVEIDAIVDNPLCEPENPVTQCAVVASTACTVLEDGDNENLVKVVLLAGIRLSILNGDFEDAIPPEHQLPPV